MKTVKLTPCKNSATPKVSDSQGIAKMTKGQAENTPPPAGAALGSKKIEIALTFDARKKIYFGRRPSMSEMDAYMASKFGFRYTRADFFGTWYYQGRPSAELTLFLLRAS